MGDRLQAAKPSW